MGDYRTVAAVSRAIAHVLENALDRRGMRGEYKVSIASPHQTSADRNHTKSINLFLYHVRPTPSLRNNDIPVFEGGRMVNVPTIGLDLYYLLSFYGNKPNDLESERLLGLAVTALNAHPLLTQVDFHASAEPDRAELGQLDTVAVTPMTLTIEEMQRLWAMFPSVPYTLSMSYCASAALLVGDEVPAPPLPVSSTNRNISPQLPPAISGLARADGADLPVTFGSRLAISGQRLAAKRVAIDVGGVRIPVPASAVTDTAIEVDLDDARLRAGSEPVSVLHLETKPSETADAGVLTRSAPAQLQLAPLLRLATVTSIEPQPSAAGQQPSRYRGKIDLVVEPTPVSGQQAGIVLNRPGHDAYAFSAQLERGKLVAAFHDLAAGRYLIRVEIAGASSLLEPQGGQPYTAPSIQITPRRPRHG
ncbi:DUF4255 domain-containing protein [Sorangium sp. So ce260]|uniref:DUF4255 domain-containing protein n=1 Tax=Sorangium sp. So ce260 TaxID=3133291 RepID=UPI003F63CE0C